MDNAEKIYEKAVDVMINGRVINKLSFGDKGATFTIAEKDDWRLLYSSQFLYLKNTNRNTLVGSVALSRVDKSGTEVERYWLPYKEEFSSREYVRFVMVFQTVSPKAFSLWQEGLTMTCVLRA